tara:strand:- start:1684 stop:1998 length:315 start_codon:yes stop_codon:yes gene_type:complete
MMEVLLILSILANCFLIWYIVQLLKRFLSFQEELDDFALKLEEYESHIDIIHGLERFYGDETLGNLLRHSKDIASGCKRFKSILNADGEEEYDDEGEEYAQEET